MKVRVRWALAACAVVAAVVAAVPTSDSAAEPQSTAVPSITVTPSTGLVSGQMVTVTGSGFTPSAQVALSDCLSAKTTQGFCTGIPPYSAFADASGNFTYQYRVARGAFDETVAPPVLVDCAAAPETCSLFAYVGGAVPQVAFAPISFDASVPPPSPVVTVTPSGPVQDGQTLEVTGTGFAPNSDAFVGQCAPEVRADFLSSPCVFLGGVRPIDSQGNLTTSLTIEALFSFPWPVNGQNFIDCSTAPGVCFVRVTSRAEPLETVDFPLTFAPPPVEIPPEFTG